MPALSSSSLPRSRWCASLRRRRRDEPGLRPGRLCCHSAADRYDFTLAVAESVHGLSWWHIVLVLLVFVLLFGTGKISGLMGDVAKGIKSFKQGMAEDEDDKAPESSRSRQGHRAQAAKPAARKKPIAKAKTSRGPKST